MVRALVREILGYLDVDTRTERAIYAVLVPSLENEKVTDPAEVYKRVTNWIDARAVPYQERFHKRLDAMYIDGKGRGRKIDQADPRAEDPLDILLRCEDGNHAGSLTFEELRETLRGELNPECFELANYLFEKNRQRFEGRKYDADLLARRMGQIEERLDASLGRFVDGHLLVPQKKVVRVTFDPVGVYFGYRAGYPDSIVRQVYSLLVEGAGSTSISRITGVSPSAVGDWRRDANLPQSERSENYPGISKFVERRLREAAQRRMSLEEAEKHSGSNKSDILGFWRRIGYDYLTPKQRKRVLVGLRICASKNQISRYAGIVPTDVEFFVEKNSLEFPEYDPENPLARYYGSFWFSGWRKSLEETRPEAFSKILEGHDQGMTNRKIAVYADVDTTTVGKKLKIKGRRANGLWLCGPLEEVRPETYRRVIEGQDKGMTVPEIAEFAGIAEKTVQRKLERLGKEPMTSPNVLSQTVEDVNRLEAGLGNLVSVRDLLDHLGDFCSRTAARRLKAAWEKGFLQREAEGDKWVYRSKCT